MRASIANMAFQERIRSSHSLNTQLVSTLSSTSNTPREVRETSQYITELQSRIEIGTKNLKSLRWKVERLRSEYEVLRDGSTKRLLSKVSGKTEELLAKTSKAEQEYQDALEEQAKANKNLEASQRNLEEAQRSLPHLKDQAAIHAATRSELGDLYNYIFALPHAEYSQETTAKQEIALLQVPISDLQKQIDRESQVLKLLTDARKCLIWSHAAIMNAHGTNSNNFAPISEHHALGVNIVRNAMSTAQLHAMQADLVFNSAQLVQPGIQNMRELKILEERLLLGSSSGPSGVSRLLDIKELTERIGECRAEMVAVIDEVGREIGVAKRRLQRLGEEKEELEGEARDILRRARQEVIGMVVEGREVDGEGREAGADEERQAPVGPPGYSP
jgi:chromosome segregation ATPase